MRLGAAREGLQAVLGPPDDVFADATAARRRYLAPSRVMEVTGTIATVVFGASLAAGVACAVTRRADVAKVARGFGLATLAMGALGIVAGWVDARSASSAPGVTPADRRRITANMVAESAYTAMATVVAAVPTLIASAWVLRKRRDAATGAPL